MKILISLILFCSLFSSCVTKANKQSLKKHSNKMELLMPDTLKTSISLKILLKQLSAENYFKKQHSKPSKALQKSYSFFQKDGIYYIKGFIHVNESFDRNKFIDLGGIITEYTNKIQSFHMPLNRMAEMFYIPGITYIELAQKVHLITH